MVTTSGPGSTIIIDGKDAFAHDLWCEAGDTVISGGFQFNPRYAADMKLLGSRPISDQEFEGWQVSSTNNDSFTRDWWAWAVCAENTTGDD